MRTQPTFMQWLPVALMVGVLAAASVLLSSTVSATPGLEFMGAVWVLFISWALWFAMGAKYSRLAKGILSVVGGVVFGWLTLLLNTEVFTPLFGEAAGMWALPVTVFFAASSIVLLELTNLFEVGFAYFFGYAGYFAYIFGGFAPEGTSNLMAVAYFSVLLIVGFAFGIATTFLKNKILNAEGVPFNLQKTIFDKE